MNERSMFLSADELIELTGYRRGAEQARWLKSNGYVVQINARGIPRITWTQVDEIRRVQPASSLPASLTNKEPNVVAFHRKLQQST